jgi:hypothetical protein
MQHQGKRLISPAPILQTPFISTRIVIFLSSWNRILGYRANASVKFVPPIHRLPSDPYAGNTHPTSHEASKSPEFQQRLGHNDASADGLLSLGLSLHVSHPHGMTFSRSLTATSFEISGTGRFEACSCKPGSGCSLPY